MNVNVKTFMAGLFAFIFGWAMIWGMKNGTQLAVNAIRDENPTEIITAATINSAETDDISTTAPIMISKKNSPGDYKNVTNDSGEITIIIGGDVMLDRHVRFLGEKYGYNSLFASITPLFKSADIVAVNLEGTITSEPSKTLLANGSTTASLSFTFASETAAALADAGITAVSLANNHSDNFGSKGFEETKKCLEIGGIEYFGDPWNTSNETLICKKTICVAFVGYNSFQEGFNRVVERVKMLSKRGDFVIVMPHWGKEYSSTATDKMKSQARELVAAGAKAVIGAHPHVVMENEWIGETPVYYSVGNLLFDQYFSPETMKGELIELRVSTNDRKVNFDSLKVIPVSNSSRKGVNVVNDK